MARIEKEQGQEDGTTLPVAWHESIWSPRLVIRLNGTHPGTVFKPEIGAVRPEIFLTMFRKGRIQSSGLPLSGSPFRKGPRYSP